MILKGFKYRIYPNAEERKVLDQHFGCVRYVYNYFLDLRSRTYAEESINLDGFSCKCKLVELKKEKSWLKDINSQSLQQSVLDLEKSYRRFFKGLGGYPVFKKKANRQSFTVPQNFKIIDGKLYIPKLKNGINIKLHRPLSGNAKTVTISKSPTGKYYASFSCEVEIEKLPKSNKEIGIDLGLNHFAILSSGEKIEHPKTLRRSQRKLSRLQKKLSAKQKGSSNRNKARLKVAALHEKIGSQRKDFLHKLSFRLIRENQAIHLEELMVKNMVKNRCLSKAISDSGWGEFIRQLAYKSEWYGRQFNQIPRFYPSSKTCNVCGFVFKDLQLSQRSWNCSQCGSIHDRDINAANVILSVGQDMPELTPVERLASVSSVLSMKQVSSAKQEALASDKMHGILIP
ncbi:MAG: RNA-guided endonuclease TnpB family protein [Desulfobacterales bacterium]|nr:RNA-guided endonuclease TnpB family protein [Desulfobacterales bacterium]